MTAKEAGARLRTRIKTQLARSFFRQRLKMHNSFPVISFTFDDFPRSALTVGGDILGAYGVRATYYGALGLMGKHSEVGDLFTLDDLSRLITEGHELGCHTFGHLDPWSATPAQFEESVIRNARAAHDWLGGYLLRSFAYPLSYPSLFVKRRTSRHFLCCRCGGQTFNSGTVDASLLKAYFLERGRIEEIRYLIELNSSRKGWLIFATHDVAPKPSPYGCTPAFINEVIGIAARSGGHILPVRQAYETIFHP